MYIDIDIDGGVGETEKALSIESDLLKDIKLIEVVVKDIVQGGGELFRVVDRGHGRYAVESQLLGKRLRRALKVSQGELAMHFPLYDLSPYICLFFKCVERVEDQLLIHCTDKVISSEVPVLVEVLNGLVEDMRKEASGKIFKAVIRRLSRSAKKRGKSLGEYIDAMFLKYARLVVIRLELSYGQGYFRGGKSLKNGLHEAKRDWARLLRDIHIGLPVEGVRGFACKMEYAHLTGFHFHLLVFYCGSKHREDITLAKALGEHWVQKITRGNGRYRNCNAKSYPERGLGSISWFELSRIKILKTLVADYLVKVDYLWRFSPEWGRAFFRGNMPSPRDSKRGRPRVYFKVQEPSGVSEVATF